MFGNKDRAEVGAAIGISGDGLVNATDLSLELGLPNSRVRAQLLALTEGGLLEPYPALGSSGKNLFKRVESPFWDGCMDLVRRALEATEAAAPSTGGARDNGEGR